MIFRKHKIKSIYKIFVVCFIIGVILALFFYNSLSKEEIMDVLASVKNGDTFFCITNNITDHLKILSVILLSSLIFIGLPLFVGLLISEGFKLAFKYIVFIKIYNYKKTIYFIIYYLINNGIYMIFLLYFYKSIIKIFKIVYKKRINKEVNTDSTLYNYLYKGLTYILLIFISDVILYFYGNNLLKIFAFLLK